MADKSLFGRLQRLFSTNVIVRNVGGKKLKVADTSRTQSIAHNNLIDRYQKLFTNSGLSGYSDTLLTKTMRLNLFICSINPLLLNFFSTLAASIMMVSSLILSPGHGRRDLIKP